MLTRPEVDRAVMLDRAASYRREAARRQSVMELMPSDVEEEWSDEDMEEANKEVQQIIEMYYGPSSFQREDV